MAGSVAVGVFDGLHLGHRAILDRARARAQEDGGPTRVVSFDPHPDVVLAKRFQPLPPLTPIPEKRERLAAVGIGLEVLPFTRELASLSPEEFVERHLVAPFAPAWLVVGGNFALGRGRAGNVERLRAIGRERGFQVEAVPIAEVDGAPVTSTRIRERLAAGDVEAAARLLGRRYDLVGRVVHGEAIGRTLGVPTANLRLHEEKLLPRLGIYGAWAKLEGEDAWRPGALSLGVRPTFGGQSTTLEVHLLDWSGDLYGREVAVEFQVWLREERAFASREALMEAMQEDLTETRLRLVRREPTPAA